MFSYSKAAMERAMKVQEVIWRAMAKKITWWQAAEIIGISDRHMRRWREGYQEFGYDGLFDRRRGKPSPKRVPLAVVEQVLGLYRDRYLDLNVRHFHEKLSDQHQIELSYSWVKQALQGAGLVARGRKRGVHRKRRPRRPLPGMLLVTEGRVHESRVARTLRFDPGTIVVFDRGYTDYAWFSALDGVYFVTRIKDNADYGVLERRPVPERGPVQRDEIIFLYKLARRGEPDLFLRRIEVWDEAQGRTLVFLTNHRRFAASTIAAIYRQRWQIELFFKALKQNLRIKTFVGTSANALQIQVWTALIALLLLKYLQLRAPLRLEPVQSRRPAAPAVVRLPRPVLLDRSALSAPASTRPHRPVDPAFLVTQLGQQNGNLNLEPNCEVPEMPHFSSVPHSHPG